MTQAELLAEIGTVLVHVTFWVSAAYIAGVSTFWPWWKTDLGWTIVLEAAAIMVVLLPFELHALFGLDPGGLAFTWLRLAAFAAVPVILVWRFVVTLVIQLLDPPPVKRSGARQRWKQRRRGGRRKRG